MASDTPDQNLSQYFPVCNDFIHAARLRDGNVLIHCLAGMSRSVTVAVAYIMSVTQLSWRESLKVVRSGRSVANPNYGFQVQLQDFELHKLAEVSVHNVKWWHYQCIFLSQLLYHFTSIVWMCICAWQMSKSGQQMCWLFSSSVFNHCILIYWYVANVGAQTFERAFSNTCNGTFGQGSMLNGSQQLRTITIE